MPKDTSKKRAHWNKGKRYKDGDKDTNHIDRKTRQAKRKEWEEIDRRERGA